MPPTTSDCSNTPPAWPCTLPRTGHPHSSEQSVPVSHLPPCKRFFCTSNLSLLTFSSKPLLLVLLLTDPCKKSSYSSRIYTPGILKGCSKVSLVSSFLLTEKPTLSQILLIGEALHTSDDFCGSFLSSFQPKRSTCFLC